MIEMWHDSSNRHLLAPDFSAWLTNYVEAMESGQMIVSEDYGIVPASWRKSSNPAETT